MKKIWKVLLSFMLALSMSLSLSTSVFAAQTVNVDQVFDTGSDAYQLVSQVFYYYSQKNSDKVSELLGELKEKSSDYYDFTKEIIDYWSEVDADDFVNEALGVNDGGYAEGYGTTTYDDTTGIPTDLPTKNHAFVVLGYALAKPTLTNEQQEASFKYVNGEDDSDGYTWDYMSLFVTNELKGRCDVAIRAANMYPNSLIFCTGGGTSNVDKNITEATAMKTYMVNNGIDASRIITEDSAQNTVQNGLNSMPEILEKGVNKITMITSDYHIRRGCMIFKGVTMRFALAGNDKIELVSNIGYDTSKNTEGLSMEYGSAGMGGVVNYSTSDVPSDSGLILSGTYKYNKGDELKLTATVDNYLSGTTDVTSKTTFTGFDSSVAGLQTVTATYSYSANRKTVKITATKDVFVLPENLYDKDSKIYPYMNEAVYDLIQKDKDGALKQLELIKENCTDSEYKTAKDIIDYAIEVDETEVTSLQGVNVTNGTKTTYDDTTDIPTDLPTENHAFIGLGFGLDTPTLTDEQQAPSFKYVNGKDDSEGYTWDYLKLFMKDELVGRCDVLIRLAKAYPNSLIFATGGGTSKSDTNVTEGMVMRAYMAQTNEIDVNRIITEDAASNTVENGLFSMPEILEKGITSMTIVSSDYHVRRGCVIFKGVAERYASATNTTPVKLVGQIGYDASAQYGSDYNKDTKEGLEMRLQMGLASTIGLSASNNLTAIKVSGKTDYKTGEELDLTTKGIYEITGEQELKDVVYTGFDNTKAGEQEVTATYTVVTQMGPRERKQEYTDTITVNVVGSLDDVTLEDISNQAYTGKKIKPALKLYTDDDDLTLGIDYEVVYTNNKDKGTANVKITGKGNYEGTKKATFNIVNNIDTETTISALKNVKYTGKAQTQDITITDSENNALVLDTDYTVAYKNNINAGIATVTITGIGDNWAGTSKKTFKITKIANTITATVKTKKVKAKKTKKKKQTVKAITVKKAIGKVTYTKKSGSKKLTINKSTGKITVKKKTKKGTYKIKVNIKAAGNKNYNAKTITKTVTVKVK